MWQKAVFEKAHRLVRLHEAIEHIEGRVPLPGHTLILIRIGAQEHEGQIVEVPVERAHLLSVLKAEERDILTDMARILRQVSET